MTRPARPPIPRRWAGALAALLARGGVACRVVGRGEYLALLIDKLLWCVAGCRGAHTWGSAPAPRQHAGASSTSAGRLGWQAPPCYPHVSSAPPASRSSIYWLLSAGLGGLPVGEVAQQHGAAVAELAAELLPLAREYVMDAGRRQGLAPADLEQVRGGGAGLSQLLWLLFLEQSPTRKPRPLPTPACPSAAWQVEALSVEGACQSMAAYSLSIPAAVPSRAMALAELRWRNGWFLARARTPAHVAWLARAGVEA